MKLESYCPTNPDHTVREIDRDSAYITLECVTCKHKLYQPITYSQSLVQEIQRGVVITPEIYSDVPDFQEEVDEDNINAMCDEYSRLVNQN